MNLDLLNCQYLFIIHIQFLIWLFVILSLITVFSNVIIIIFTVLTERFIAFSFLRLIFSFSDLIFTALLWIFIDILYIHYDNHFVNFYFNFILAGLKYTALPVCIFITIFRNNEALDSFCNSSLLSLPNSFDFPYTFNVYAAMRSLLLEECIHFKRFIKSFRHTFNTINTIFIHFLNHSIF